MAIASMRHATGIGLVSDFVLFLFSSSIFNCATVICHIISSVRIGAILDGNSTSSDSGESSSPSGAGEPMSSVERSHHHHRLHCQNPPVPQQQQ